MPAEAPHSAEPLYPAPPWSWAERRALFHHWVREPLLAGLSDVLPHQGMRLLPVDAVSALGARLGMKAGASRPEASERARALFRQLRPEATADAIERMLDAHWRHVGRCFAEFSCLDRLWPRVTVDGLQNLEAPRRAGRPVLIAGLHVGYWELVHLALARLRIPATGIYQRQPNRFRMKIAIAARERSWRGGIPVRQLLPTSAALFAAQRVLSKPDGVMLYYVDEYWEGRVHAPALGRAPRPEGNIAKAVRLAAASGAAVIPCYALRVGDAARFRLVFAPEVPMGPPGRGRAGAVADQATLDAAMEQVVRATPEQWFMAHVFRPDAGPDHGG